MSNQEGCPPTPVTSEAEVRRLRRLLTDIESALLGGYSSVQPISPYRLDVAPAHDLDETTAHTTTATAGTGGVCISVTLEGTVHHLDIADDQARALAGALIRTVGLPAYLA